MKHTLSASCLACYKRSLELVWGQGPQTAGPALEHALLRSGSLPETQLRSKVQSSYSVILCHTHTSQNLRSAYEEPCLRPTDSKGAESCGALQRAAAVSLPVGSRECDRDPHLIPFGSPKLHIPFTRGFPLLYFWKGLQAGEPGA